MGLVSRRLDVLCSWFPCPEVNAANGRLEAYQPSFRRPDLDDFTEQTSTGLDTPARARSQVAVKLRTLSAVECILMPCMVYLDKPGCSYLLVLPERMSTVTPLGCRASLRLSNHFENYLNNGCLWGRR